LVYDPVKVEDVDTEGEDHAYDALRYGLKSASRRTGEKPKELRAQELVGDAVAREDWTAVAMRMRRFEQFDRGGERAVRWK
jgi:hypothetical protein